MKPKMAIIRGRCINKRCNLPLDLKVYVEDVGRLVRAKVVCEACGCTGPAASTEDVATAEASAIALWDALPRWEASVVSRASEVAETIRAAVAEAGNLGVVELKARGDFESRWASADALAAILEASGFGG